MNSDCLFTLLQSPWPQNLYLSKMNNQHGLFVGLCVDLCLRTSLMYDVYDFIEHTETVKKNY